MIFIKVSDYHLIYGVYTLFIYKLKEVITLFIGRRIYYNSVIRRS